MPIDKGKAIAALEKLLEKGGISRQQADGYAAMVEAGVSYADFMIKELGEEIGKQYLAEEFMQHLVLHKKTLYFDKLSVPEALLFEGEEPWHGAEYSSADAATKFSMEAAEGWHSSLRKKFDPHPKVSAYFNDHPNLWIYTARILKAVYG